MNDIVNDNVLKVLVTVLFCSVVLLVAMLIHPHLKAWVFRVLINKYNRARVESMDALANALAVAILAPGVLIPCFVFLAAFHLIAHFLVAVFFSVFIFLYILMQCNKMEEESKKRCQIDDERTKQSMARMNSMGAILVKDYDRAQQMIAEEIDRNFCEFTGRIWQRPNSLGSQLDWEFRNRGCRKLMYTLVDQNRPTFYTDLAHALIVEFRGKLCHDVCEICASMNPKRCSNGHCLECVGSRCSNGHCLECVG
ncbi:MAG: hypothetical protein JW816_02360, partial [Candidatus Buchananbacteria bacterium]|nr:hypothetical protein [Candidatus Buchananbacteria bacterium]